MGASLTDGRSANQQIILSIVKSVWSELKQTIQLTDGVNHETGRKLCGHEQTRLRPKKYSDIDLKYIDKAIAGRRSDRSMYSSD